MNDRFDEILEPSEKDNPSVDMPDMESDPVKIDMSKEPIPPALLMKVNLVVRSLTKYNISPNFVQGNDKEISRDEETTVILQLDILRGIHSDLHTVGQVCNANF